MHAALFYMRNGGLPLAWECASGILSYMPYRPIRRRPSFREALGDYLLGELRALGRIFALVLLALFLLSSLFLRMYQLLRSLLLILLTN